MKAWRPHTVRGRIVVIYGLLTVIPILAITGIGYWYYSSEMESEIGHYVSQTVFQANRHVDTYLDEIERLTLLPFYDTTVMSILAKPAGSGNLMQNYQEYKYMNRFLASAMLNPREDLLGVFIYKQDGRLFFNDRFNATLNDTYAYKASEWYRRTEAGGGRVVYLGHYRDNRFRNAPRQYFSVARLLKDERNAPIGALIIERPGECASNRPSGRQQQCARLRQRRLADLQPQFAAHGVHPVRPGYEASGACRQERLCPTCRRIAEDRLDDGRYRSLAGIE